MIQELAKEIQLNRFLYDKYNEKLCRLRTSLEKTTSSMKDVVAFGKKQGIEDKLNKIIELENNLKELDYEYKVLVSQKERLIKIFQENSDRDRLIYIDYKINHYSPVKIMLKYGISRPTFFRTIRKIEGEFNEKVS